MKFRAPTEIVYFLFRLCLDRQNYTKLLVAGLTVGALISSVNYVFISAIWLYQVTLVELSVILIVSQLVFYQAVIYDFRSDKMSSFKAIILLILMEFSIIIIFALVYQIIFTFDNMAFSGLKHASIWNILYFSKVILSTVGFGDIVPVSAVARLAVLVEITIATLFNAIVVPALLIPLINRIKDSS